PVETVLLEPVERVVNEEVAHGAALLAVVVDGRAPRRVMRRVEELRSVGVKVVAFGPEMVVHDVQKNHQRTRMRRIDEALELVRRAITRVGRKWQHAVVAPVASAGKIGQRHELDRGYAQIGEIVESLDRRGKASLGGEGA